MDFITSQENMFAALKKLYADGADKAPQEFMDLQEQIKVLRDLRAEEASKPPNVERSQKVAAALAKLTQAAGPRTVECGELTSHLSVCLFADHQSALRGCCTGRGGRPVPRLVVAPAFLVGRLEDGNTAACREGHLKSAPHPAFGRFHSL